MTEEPYGEQAQLIKSLWESGVRNKREIGRRVGTSHAQVTRTLDRYGIEDYPAQVPPSNGDGMWQEPELESIRERVWSLEGAMASLFREFSELRGAVNRKASIEEYYRDRR